MDKLKTIAFHITDDCSAHCPMCYEQACRREDLHGEIETLKKIVHNAIKNGKVENFLLVGGDPCEHPHLMELLRFIKSEGEKYGVNTYIEVLSNTHDYKDNGKPVSMEEVAKYVDKLNVTVHGETAQIHDAFNGVPGSYEHMMDNVVEFAKVKGEEQSVGITVNVMPSTVGKMTQIIYSANQRLGGIVEDVCVQRIAPMGRATGQTRYFIEKQDVNVLMAALDEVDKNGIGIEICDCFPYCSVKPEYRHLLPKGGCNWGTEFLSVARDGSMTRCALSSTKLSATWLELDTEEKFLQWWENDPLLRSFREKLHLSEACSRCVNARECGGGCLMARKGGDPYKPNGEISNDGNDYLAEL